MNALDQRLPAADRPGTGNQTGARMNTAITVTAVTVVGPSSFCVELDNRRIMLRRCAILGRVNGSELDAGARPTTLAKSLSAKDFLASKRDGRGRLTHFPLAGRSGGGWVGTAVRTPATTHPPSLSRSTQRHRAKRSTDPRPVGVNWIAVRGVTTLKADRGDWILARSAL